MGEALFGGFVLLICLRKVLPFTVFKPGEAEAFTFKDFVTDIRSYENWFWMGLFLTWRW